MATHQHDANATALWLRFNAVITWVKATFPTYRKEMKGVDWGNLYTRFDEGTWDAKALEAEVARLMADSDVTNKKGHLRLRPRRRRTQPEHPRLRRQHQARGLRTPKRNLRQVRQTLRHQGNGSRPHHAVVTGRPHHRRQLPDALPRLQPPQERPLTRPQNSTTHAPNPPNFQTFQSAPPKGRLCISPHLFPKPLRVCLETLRVLGQNP